MRCGFYEVEITPPLGTTIFGYFQARVNEGVITKLYAKAAVLESGGKHIAFLGLDMLGLPKGLADFVRESVNERIGIDKDAILIGATHSHTSGPTTDTLGNFKDRLPMSDDEPVLNPELDSFYLRMIQLLSADAIIHAYQRLEEVDVSFGIGEVNGVNFVREYVLKNGEVRTNPGEYIDQVVKPVAEPDRSLPVFFVRNKEGKPLGMLTSFALHHDTIHGSKCCADYSGMVADNMKEEYGKNFITVFFSGFCGNINHFNYMHNTFVRTRTDKISAAISAEVVRLVETMEPLKEEILDAKWDTVAIKKRAVPKEHCDRVLALKANPPAIGEELTIADPYCDIMVYAGANSFINRYVKDTKEEYDVPVHVVRIGECLIYGFCGEIFSQFGDIIRKESPTDKLMLVEKSNTEKIDCYVPTREMFLPDVYESTVTSAYLCPDAGYQMCDKVIEMAKKIMN